MLHQSIDHGSGLRFANFRPQPLEVASLLKLAATNVLFPRGAFFVRPRLFGLHKTRMDGFNSHMPGPVLNAR
jgi:hypothetical protein